MTYCFQQSGSVILTQRGVTKVSIIEGRSNDQTPAAKIKCSKKNKKQQKKESSWKDFDLNGSQH